MKRCDTCKWHDSFSCACCNGLSIRRGDFTDIDECCDVWECQDQPKSNYSEGDAERVKP